MIYPVFFTFHIFLNTFIVSTILMVINMVYIWPEIYHLFWGWVLILAKVDGGVETQASALTQLIIII